MTPSSGRGVHWIATGGQRFHYQKRWYEVKLASGLVLVAWPNAGVWHLPGNTLVIYPDAVVAVR